MAKSARASSTKANNAALKKNVFGPVEAARDERLAAKLAALIAAPKPSEIKNADVMETETARITSAPLKSALKVTKAPDAMEIDDSAEAKAPQTSSNGIKKRKKADNRRSAIVFPKYKAGKKIGTKVRKARRSAA